MTVARIGNLNNKFSGLSTDTKPTSDIYAGATFYEYDLQRLFVWTGSVWTLKQPPSLPTASVLISLNQAAGAYDVFTAGVDTRVLSLTAVIFDDLTGDAAGALTGITIQSTDTSPVEFIGATAGAKAKLSANAHLQYNGNAIVATSKKIQLSIVGGATGTAKNCLVYLTYAGVV